MAPLPGVGWGLLGVLAFSFTVPMTRLATEGGLPALFVGCGRAVVAAALAAAALLLTRQPLPTRIQVKRLCVVAGGVVLGFPLLTSLALRDVPAAHGAVVVGLLPAATAAVGVVRGRESVPATFWTAAGVGAAAVIAFAVIHDGSLGAPGWADVLLVGAVVAAATGYAEGGLLARDLGAWQTVSWALVLSSPVTGVLSVVAVVGQTPSASALPWLAFGYLCVISMYVGFFAWYRGLALGPITTVSQVQLVQPVLSIVWSAVLLHERLRPVTVVGAMAVVACAGVAVRTRLRPPHPRGPRRARRGTPSPRGDRV